VHLRDKMIKILNQRLSANTISPIKKKTLSDTLSVFINRSDYQILYFLILSSFKINAHSIANSFNELNLPEAPP
jgi:hypothetical protein